MANVSDVYCINTSTWIFTNQTQALLSGQPGKSVALLLKRETSSIISEASGRWNAFSITALLPGAVPYKDGIYFVTD